MHVRILWILPKSTLNLREARLYRGPFTNVVWWISNYIHYKVWDQLYTHSQTWTVPHVINWKVEMNHSTIWIELRFSLKKMYLKMSLENYSPRSPCGPFNINMPFCRYKHVNNKVKIVGQTVIYIWWKSLYVESSSLCWNWPRTRCGYLTSLPRSFLWQIHHRRQYLLIPW